jgi:5-formyltetrahydrofolate cyclo-ligase
MNNEEKERVRREYLARRRRMGEGEVADKSRAIRTRVEGIIRQRGTMTVMAYVSVRNEVETADLIRTFLAEGKKVAVPLCVQEEMGLLACRVENPEEDLVVGHYGIPEPREGKRRLLPLEELEMVLVPGVAFDRSGYRLGHGSGYYDRFLGNLPPTVNKVGLAYDWQIVEQLPRNSYDVPVDLVVTETQTINPKEKI